MGLYSTSNPGTFPAGAVDFVFVETQRMYTADAVRQIATQYGGSGSNVIAPRQWVRLHSNSGTYSTWAEILTQASVVGTVSESAGVPTGALIESGNNANGSYTRFADGTQICSSQKTTTTTINVNSGGLFVNSSDIVSLFPVAFAARTLPTVTLQAMRPSGSAFDIDTTMMNFGSNAVIYRLTRRSSDSVARAITVNVVAIGQWF